MCESNAQILRGFDMTISYKLQLWLLTAALFAGIMLILMFLILMFGCGAAGAATRYVDSSAGGGGDGTSDTPWNTIAAAVSGATDGDTILISGTFTENFVLSTQQAKGFTWTANPSCTVTCADDAYDWPVRLSSNTKAHTFNGITFASAATMVGMVYINSASAKTTFNNCTFNISSSVPSPVLFYIAGAANGNDIEFDGCAFNVTATGGGNEYFFLFEGTSNGRVFTLTDNVFTVTEPIYYGLSYCSTGSLSGIIIERNTGVFANFGGETRRLLPSGQQRATNISIKDNVFTMAAGSILYLSSTVAGTATVSGNIFYKNSATGNYGIVIGTDTSGATDNKLTAVIEKNALYAHGYYNSASTNSLPGIIIGFQNNGIIRNNYVTGAGYGCVIMGNATAGLNAAVYGNVIHNNGTSGAITIKGAGNAHVYNNTIYGTADYTLPDAGILLSADGTEYSTATIGNNIISLYDGVPLIRIDANCTLLGSDYNAFYNTTGSGFDFSYLGSAKTFTTWKSSTGFDGNSLTVDPILLDSTASNLSLGYNSPCIGAGANLGSTYSSALHPLSNFSDSDTIYTITRPSTGAWDIGAFRSLRDAGLIGSTTGNMK